VRVIEKFGQQRRSRNSYFSEQMAGEIQHKVIQFRKHLKCTVGEEEDVQLM
jgi:hypothetical protein